MTDILIENVKKIRDEVANAAIASGRNPDDVKIVPATKTVPAERINLLLQCGIDTIGENRVQELLEKYDKLDRRFSIHFIGKLQTNKVKYIIDKVDLIHSVDSIKLCEEIGKRALAIGKVMDILVEINIGREESKAGVLPEDAVEFVRKASEVDGVRVVGLMIIPPRIITENDSSACAERGSSQKIYTSSIYFENIKKLSLDILTKNMHNVIMRELSMGMSDDYVEAVLNGSTIVRPGRAIFGERVYK